MSIQRNRTTGLEREKAADSIRTKLSESLYELVYKAALSQDPLRADKIYRFLIYAFSVGPAVTDMLHLPEVFDIIQMERNLDRELQHLKGFTRFSQMSGNILLGKINPKNDILELLSLHFADRLSGEHWILYDEKRQKAAVHHADGRWVVVSTRSKAWMEFLSEETDEPVYENLWKTFHQSIAIPERTNRACQTQMLPLRFRPYMTEFQ